MRRPARKEKRPLPLLRKRAHWTQLHASGQRWLHHDVGAFTKASSSLDSLRLAAAGAFLRAPPLAGEILSGMCLPAVCNWNVMPWRRLPARRRNPAHRRASQQVEVATILRQNMNSGMRASSLRETKKASGLLKSPEGHVALRVEKAISVVCVRRLLLPLSQPRSYRKLVKGS